MYEGAKASFNSAAEQYDAARPGYPAGLIRRIVQKAGLTGVSRILEVGAGTGKASVLFARRGFEMLCLEPGVQRGDIARRNLAAFPRVEVETTTFEDWPVQRGRFDLVTAPQAFHWIEPEIGYPKAAEALKAGGWIALFWNLAADPETGIYAEIQDAYHRFAPDMERRQQSRSLTEEVKEMGERLAAHSDLFPIRKVYRFAWKRSYSADEYLGLAGTYSDHIALSEAARARLFQVIRDVIEGHSGAFVKHYSTMLAMAQKRSK